MKYAMMLPVFQAANKVVLIDKCMRNAQKTSPNMPIELYLYAGKP